MINYITCKANTIHLQSLVSQVQTEILNEKNNVSLELRQKYFSSLIKMPMTL